MPILSLTTELDAVNEMLGAIGELPVSEIADAGNTDTAVAVRTLRGISREVQSKGCWFNTDEAFEFTLTSNGRVPLPNQILSIRPLRARAQRLTHRAGYLYDLSGSTDRFTEAPVARVVWLYDFEMLPETARRYIAIRAARIFQKNQLGSEALNGFTEQHEEEAFYLFQTESFDFEASEGANFMDDDPDTQAIGGIG